MERSPEHAESDLAPLLAAAGAGDDRAWREIIERYARRVYSLARSRLGASRHDLAEEVTQSVFVTVATKLRSDEPGYREQGRFESWLFRIAMNRVRDEVRRSRRQAAATEGMRLTLAAGTSDAAEPDADLPQSLAALRRALERLSDADREIVELRHHAGLSFREIAEMLEEPLGTLLARHHRALRKLKEMLGGSVEPETPRQGAVP